MARCKSCNADITWVITTRGKKMPVDASPVLNGNLALEFKNGGYESRPATDEDRKLKRQLYISHFATCPQGPSWRES
jgi:hypothetical protein